MKLSHHLKTKISINSWLIKIIIICTSLFITTNIDALDKNELKISLNLTDVSLFELLTEFEKVSGFHFRYTESITTDTRKFSFDLIDLPVTEALEEIAKEAGLSYIIDGSNVSIKLLEKSKISGRITDAATGTPLTGVTISIKGTTDGTITDFDGNYNISTYPNSALVFSYIGYKKQEAAVKNRTIIDLPMEPEAEGIDEVVVIGYGTRKEINLTGAVDHINSESFQNKTMSNVSRGLQGQLPNLNITLGDGKPLRSPEFNIRGTTSIGSGGSALVLINGVPGDANMLNPSEIESVSILKDAASAAIYGARGSFGVVLITTKEPKDMGFKVNYSGCYSLSDRTIKPDLVTDGYEWASTFNEAYYAWNDYATYPSKVNSVFPFSQDYLANLEERHNDPSMSKVSIDPSTGKYIYYGSTDWLKELYADVIPSNEHSINISGRKEGFFFYLSGHYLQQDGIFRYNPDKYKMYNIRNKVSVDVFKWLNIENEFAYSQKNYFYPILNHSSNTPVFRRISDEAFPIAMLKNPDGTLTQNAAIVFGSFISGNNYQDYLQQDFTNTCRFSAKMHRNLNIKGDFTFRYTPNQQTSLYTPVPYSTEPDVISERGDSKKLYWDKKTTYTNTNLYAEYNKNFNHHSFIGLIGYNYEYSLYEKIYISRYNVIDADLPDFSLIDGENVTITGGGNEWKFLGLFYRLNYNYKEKYLIEFNGRYDGSSKFSENRQYGFFPSFSGGWRISEEPFWENLKQVISNFKLRASYGSLGNGNVDPYTFLETMAVSKSDVIIDGALPNYTSSPSVVSDNLTWETVTTTNFGINLDFFNYKLNTSFDYYIRNTYDMITESVTLPAVFGASEPDGNFADLQTKGWELSIQWQDNIGKQKPLHYDIRFTLSDYTSKITKYSNPTNSLEDYYEGYQIGDIWGYETNGFFVNEQDIIDHADQSYVRVSASNIPLPGDLKFEDLDNSGVIDPGSNTLDDPGDQHIIGNSNPRFQYGFTANTEWNNFYINMFFQGIGKRDYWPGKDNSLFWGAYNRPYSHHPKYVEENIWSEENSDTYFPRMRGYVALNTRGEMQLTQSRYLQNAAYIRLKNITFGYSIPKKLLYSVKIDDLKLYINGQNLWVYSPMFKHGKNLDPEALDGSDPETASDRGNGNLYPMLKTISFGINVTF